MFEIEKFGEILLQKKLKFACAESCTGGLVAKMCTDYAGSSAWFDRGYVTYSNQSKMDMLNVNALLIAKHGAVSQSVAIAMVTGVIKNSHAQIATAITGIAGPDGGSKEKPVGTVWIAWAMNNKIWSEKFIFDGTRSEVRSQAANQSLSELVKKI